MQFQVPQFIETEDKIVGPFTLKQFIYLGAAGTISFILYSMVETWLFIILAMLLVALAIGLAFLRVNGRPIADLIFAGFSFFWKPQTYVWQPEHPQVKKEDVIRASGSGILESIIQGLTFRNTWRSLQTGEKHVAPTEKREDKRRFEILRRMSGEREAVRRIDYR